ncbi:hypothetical protein AVEN_117587-1 [Araneus ventricosus]|uniref:Uncharacterized protein n=1 Tax=Araneus ventricosus TaxID=182803 RepID=A0A4Y2UHH4_ARAVE|nr:hypothetical protein AVEN_117587-1 [Araneus ventricosus]
MRTRRVSRQNLASLWDIRGWIKKSYKGIYLNAGPASQQITPAPPLLERKSPNPSTTYAEVTKKHQASKKTPTLLLYPMKSAEKEEVLEILKREIARPSTKIKDVQKIKNKGIAVQLERDQDVEELIQTINNEVQEALAINADITESLNIRFKLSGRQSGTAHWILETPSESFHKLKRLGNFPIHWTMHKVRNFFHIKRCNSCQGFRHLAKDSLPIGLLEEAVLVTIPLESADHLRWSASIVLCTTNSTEPGFLPITTHPTAAAPATWER